MATDREKEREGELESAMYANCLLLGLDPAVLGSPSSLSAGPRASLFRHSNPRLGEQLLYFLLSSLRGPAQLAKDLDKVCLIFDSAQSREFRKIVQGIISELEQRAATEQLQGLATCCGPKSDCRGYARAVAYGAYRGPRHPRAGLRRWRPPCMGVTAAVSHRGATAASRRGAAAGPVQASGGGGGGSGLELKMGESSIGARPLYLHGSARPLHLHGAAAGGGSGGVQRVVLHVLFYVYENDKFMYKCTT